jgi:DNA mismatch repair protein MutS2
MIYPNTFEEKIGFDQIRTFLKHECVSTMGAALVDNIACSDNFDDIAVNLEQTNEFRNVLLLEDSFQPQDFYDLKEALAKIRIEGSYIEPEELNMLRDFINAIIRTVVYFRILHEDNKYPKLWEICSEVTLEKPLLESINKILDPKGNLRDNASDELKRIKREILRISGEADRKIKKLLNNAKMEGIVKEGAEMTIRNGRLCIPVPAPFKRKLKGFIHDESATGQTVFIEPAEVFDANNELKDLVNAEHKEIIKILTEISNQIRPSIPNLMTHHDFIGQIDFIRAKAKFAIRINALKPLILNQQIINWRQAVHPLLYLNFQEAKKIVQPLDIKLEPTERILIISGPNAGGKSVCLKTVGLLQYMMQCGLLTPVKEDSEMGIFSDFFINIGDEQSIENDLSTYSSHLNNLNLMVQNLNEKSLFLIDEFGSGTEPTLGGAMAEAILESIYFTKAFGIITTHYGNLKMFSDFHKEAVNGAMLFDTNAMRPLFILKIGKPGSSFTYEIAKKIGLPDEIIESAIQKSGTAQIDYERKLEEIEIEKIEIDKMLKMVHAADDQLALMIKEYSDKFNQLDKQRKEILQNAKNQASIIIDSANKMIEKTIRDIKEAKAETNRTKEIRENVKNLKTELSKEIESIEKVDIIKPFLPTKVPTQKTTPKPIPEAKIRVGDFVLMTDTQTTGEVTKLKGEDITITFNSISLRTTIDKVVKVSKKEVRTAKRGGTRFEGGTLSDAMNRKVSQFSHTLDLRGKRADEAVKELEFYLDEASLLSIHQVKILHGKGDGILRHVVRQFLSKRKDIKSFRDEVLELGGYGITVVDM